MIYRVRISLLVITLHGLVSQDAALLCYNLRQTQRWRKQLRVSYIYYTQQTQEANSNGSKADTVYIVSISKFLTEICHSNDALTLHFWLVGKTLKVTGHAFLLYDFIQLLKPSVKKNNFCQL